MLPGAQPWITLPILAVGFWILARCADVFVDRSVRIAHRFKIPNIVIGIVLVSLATTVPEMAVSVTSALQAKPEIALGNALGSVICNAGLALGLCAIVARRPIPVLRKTLSLSAAFLLGMAALAFLMVARDRTLQRWEGGVLLALLGLYFWGMLRQRHATATTVEAPIDEPDCPTGRLFLDFGLALLGVVAASRIVLAAAIGLATSFRIPTALIALTVIALGTSIPEIATCVSAGRRGHGDIAVGNILGANILNIGWIAAGSAVIHPLQLSRREFHVMFPAMFLLVALSLFVLYTHTVLTRREGWWLLATYLVVSFLFFVFFTPLLAA